jgi:hypothetical protein
LPYNIDITVIFSGETPERDNRYIMGRGPEMADFSSSSLTARPKPYTSITGYNWEM